MRLLHTTEDKPARLEPTVDSAEGSATKLDVETAKAEIPTAKLIKRLGSPFPWVRRRAARLLAEHGDAVVPELVAAWNDVKSRVRRGNRGTFAALAIGVCAEIGWKTILAQSGSHFWDVAIAIAFVGCLLVQIAVGLVVTSVGLLNLSPAWCGEAIKRILRDCGDVRAVGVAVDGLAILLLPGKMGNATKQAEVRACLLRLLPLIQPGESGLLNERQRRSLRNVLRRAANPKPSAFWECEPELVIATLRALTVIGDGATLPYAESLANMDATTPAQERIRETAQECVETLREWTEREKNGQILLRGAPAPGCDELLHPVNEKPEAAPEQLLHPADYAK